MSEPLPVTNARLNDIEFGQRKTVLESYPRSLFVQLDAPCNQDCLFCSRPEVYRHFDLEDFRRRFEATLLPALERAERINLTGSGEHLLLPAAKKNLAYFDRFKDAEKMFATNGSSLTPKIADFLASSDSRYTIHVSLHGSNEKYHRIMSGGGNYDVVLHNLSHIRRLRKHMAKITINFIFLATTRNVADLVDFVRFAYDYGADGVVVYYNYVYRRDQLALNCFFAKDETNAMLDKAREYAGRLEKESGGRFRIFLPPKFGEGSYPSGGVCGEPWSQMMINPPGDVISCDIAGDSRETLNGKSFMDAWNGEYFQRLRAALAAGTNACSRYCFRANPGAVNDLRSHLITRGKTEAEIKEFLEGACA